jgi:tRNA pseudouridine55 synthase
VQRRPVHGVLLLDKPLGLSSNQALQKVKWLLRAEKAGHTGTLDPLATGVLPLCFGAATKFSQQHLDANKRYQATLRLGQATTTGDAEGDIVATAPVPVWSESDLQCVALQLTGPQQQVPPMYSALKKDGKPLYEYARAGEVVERAARDIEIFDLKIVPVQSIKVLNAIEFEASCSKGTYIRTLGEDIARALGTVGHLSALRRVETGSFVDAQCVSLDQLEAMSEQTRWQCLLPIEVLLGHHTRVTLTVDDVPFFLRGMRRRINEQDASEVMVFGPSALLLGTARILKGELIPVRLLSHTEYEQLAMQRQAVQAQRSESEMLTD